MIAAAQGAIAKWILLGSDSRTDIPVLTFHNSKLRRNQRVDEKPKSNTDTAQDRATEAEAQRRAGARRTAWIIGAVAVALFIASLVQGHLSHIPH